MDPGVIGGAIGGLIGLAGGIFGTWCSIRKTKTSKERSFIIKAATITWIAILIFLVLILTIPTTFSGSLTESCSLSASSR